jgi:hypothetical protein
MYARALRLNFVAVVSLLLASSASSQKESERYDFSVPRGRRTVGR